VTEIKLTTIGSPKSEAEFLTALDNAPGMRYFVPQRVRPEVEPGAPHPKTWSMQVSVFSEDERTRLLQRVRVIAEAVSSEFEIIFD
jgi:hypothetical protein